MLQHLIGMGMMALTLISTTVHAQVNAHTLRDLSSFVEVIGNVATTKVSLEVSNPMRCSETVVYQLQLPLAARVTSVEITQTSGGPFLYPMPPLAHLAHTHIQKHLNTCL